MPSGVYKRTKEAKLKISKNHARYWLGKKRPELKGVFTSKNKTWELSEEVKKKMGKKRLGIPLSDKHKEKLRQNHVGFTGLKHSKKTRILLSEKHRGEKSSNWKGGITKINEQIRKRIEFRLWREAVFARDNWVCQECFIRGGELQGHHIKPFSLFPELRFSIDNGLTLCKDCHKKTDTYGGRIKNYKLKGIRNTI